MTLDVSEQDGGFGGSIGSINHSLDSNLGHQLAFIQLASEVLLLLWGKEGLEVCKRGL